MHLVPRKSGVSGEFYAIAPTVPVFPLPDVAGAWLRPALIAAGTPLVGPLVSRAPRRGFGHSIGVVLYLMSVALLAAATIGVFFGLAFSLLRQPANALVSERPVGGRNSDAGTSPERGLPGAKGATLGGLKTAATAKTAQPMRPEVVPATPGPAQKTPASMPTKAEAHIPKALRLPDRQLAELVARGDAFLHGGDIASARLFYERAADGGDGQAALRMGATFDPTFLANAGLRNMRADPAKARFWYHRAVELGASAAEPHLNSLETK